MTDLAKLYRSRPIRRRMTRAERLDARFWQHPFAALVVVVLILGSGFFALLKWLLT